MYPKLIVYYFSGTGNSLKVALWLSQTAKEMNMETELINIANVATLHQSAPTPDALLAFTSPVHGFNYPPVMLHFIHRFPKGKNDILLINTRAGMLIGKWITPGLSGITFYFSGLRLLRKGYHIKAMYPVDLPSNWISVHPGLNEQTVTYLHEQNKKRVSSFAHKVLTGQPEFKKAASELIQDVIVAPVALGYYFFGRFMFAKTYFASAECDKCDACVKNCPVKAIIKVNNRPFWTLRCEKCMRCMSNCPKKAIETAHGSLLAFSVINSVALTAFFQNYIQILFFPIKNEFVEWIVQSIIFIGLFTVWYRIIHYLMHFKWIERAVVFTSLTRYKFWGRRYKAPRDKDN